MSFYNSHAGKIYYQIQGSGYPLIFIHGRTLDHLMWQPQINHFSYKYRCISYDLNGFGQSEIPSNNYNRSQTLSELINHLHLKKFSVIALSLGVDILIDYLLTYKANIQSMVLISGGVSGWNYSQKFMNDWNQITTQANQGNLNKAKDLWLNCQAFNPLKTNHPHNYQLLRKIINNYSGWDLLDNAPNHQRIIENAINHLTQINVPSLILTGNLDYPDFINNAKLLSEKLPNSQLIQFPQGGHMLNLEYPEKINQLISSFLRNPSFIKSIY